MKLSRSLHLAGSAAFLLFVTAAPALAFQEGGEGGKAKKSWLELFQTTGPVGYLMLGCSIAGTTLVIEHMVSLRREKLAPAVLAGDLEALINEEQYDQAIELADENPCYLGNVVGSALRMRDAGYQEMIAGLEAATSSTPTPARTSRTSRTSSSRSSACSSSSASSPR